VGLRLALLAVVVTSLSGCLTSIAVGTSCCAACLGGCAAATTPQDSPAPLPEVGP